MSELSKSIKNLQLYKEAKKPPEFTEGKDGEPKLEGISFRFKTVQFHIIDDFFEELKKDDKYGDLKIYSERFSLPGYGITDAEASVTGDEFQFEIICLIESDLDQETYFTELGKVLTIIEDKHDLLSVVTPSEEFYNVSTILFHTDKKGVFSED